MRASAVSLVYLLCKRDRSLAAALGAALLLTGCDTSTSLPSAEPPDQPFPPVGIEDGWFTVGGEKFLVVGVGYEIGARPGRVPWAHDDQPDLLRADFERIVDAGFNTVRTWGPMSDAEVELAAEYGLWVVMGLWIDPAADFSDPAFREKSLAFYEREITRLAKHPNILCYLLLNEPHGDTVYRTGLDEVNSFYRAIARTARACDPARPISYANCVFTDFMKPEMFDFVALNAYPYSPGTIERALGYRTYLEQVHQQLGPDKPLLVTEFGLSVSPTGDGRGYGGNSLVEQRDGVVHLWDEVLNAGACGGCAFMWVDGWWKKGDENVHNDHAEEWYGLLEADSDYRGVPRPVYHALQAYNRFIRTMPRDDAEVAGSTPVEVWAPGVAGVEIALDEGTAQPLERQGPWWWRTTLDLSSLESGPYTVHLIAYDAGGEALPEKTSTIRVGDAAPLRVQVLPAATAPTVGEPIEVVVQVTDGHGAPLADKTVRIERFIHTGWNEMGTETRTGANGLARARFAPLTRPGIISLAAGVADGTRRRGDYLHLEVAGAP